MLPAVFEQIILLQPQTNRGSVSEGTISSVFKLNIYKYEESSIIFILRLMAPSENNVIEEINNKKLKQHQIPPPQ